MLLLQLLQAGRGSGYHWDPERTHKQAPLSATTTSGSGSSGLLLLPLLRLLVLPAHSPRQSSQERVVV